jgi:hypothetical protein
VSALCIQCKQPAIPRCHSEAGRREFAISGMCEVCFDAMFAEEDDEFADNCELADISELEGAEVHTLTELQYAEIGEGPWKLYIYGEDEFHSGGMWFRKGKAEYPDEEITLQDAKEWADAAMRNKREVRICDGGDMLVFHSVNGVVLYGEGFWEAVTQ